MALGFMRRHRRWLFAFLWIVMIYGLRVDLYPGVIMIALRKAIYGY